MKIKIYREHIISKHISSDRTHSHVHHIHEQCVIASNTNVQAGRGNLKQVSSWNRKLQLELCTLPSFRAPPPPPPPPTPKVAANRFAPHLERCMLGKGRASARAAASQLREGWWSLCQPYCVWRELSCRSWSSGFFLAVGFTFDRIAMYHVCGQCSLYNYT